MADTEETEETAATDATVKAAAAAASDATVKAAAAATDATAKAAAAAATDATVKAAAAATDATTKAAAAATDKEAKRTDVIAEAAKDCKSPKPMKAGQAAFILITLTVAILPVAMFARPGLNYILVMLIMLLFLATVGRRISGSIGGILINERKLMSLSRFQMAMWTVIILSAFLTMAAERIRWDNLQTALNIALDWRLWTLMGISTASLIGTPLVQGAKTSQEPKATEMKKAEEALKANGTPESKEVIDAHKQGVLYANACVTDAAFSDMFEGDEIGNTAFVDVAKVQMFLFTLIAGLSYAVLLYNTIRTKQPYELSEFPTLNEGFIAILGISHAGYLVNKTSDHTATT